jgi:hypothetical protein
MVQEGSECAGVREAAAGSGSDEVVRALPIKNRRDRCWLLRAVHRFAGSRHFNCPFQLQTSGHLEAVTYGTESTMFRG